MLQLLPHSAESHTMLQLLPHSAESQTMLQLLPHSDIYHSYTARENRKVEDFAAYRYLPAGRQA